VTCADDMSRHPGNRHQGGEEFTLVIRALRSDVPPVVRLRHALKAILRTYEFRAVSVSETTPRLPPEGGA
jgi:hypothetical protein